MILICGTIPLEDFPPTFGPARLEGQSVIINGSRIPCSQGTAALLSAALITAEHMRIPPPHAVLVGDCGRGKGSRELYEYLIQNINDISPDILVLHYCLPIVTLTKKLFDSISKCHRRPILIADASSMYAAKAAGLAPSFDVFTPDFSELAFLADPQASHPAYISRYLFESDLSKLPDLITAAYHHHNAARILIVKGATDYIVENGKILHSLQEPDIPELEAIGGTGDTITGMIGPLVQAGLNIPQAALIAAKANRMAGRFAQATVATGIHEIIARFPDVLQAFLETWISDSKG